MSAWADGAWLSGAWLPGAWGDEVDSAGPFVARSRRRAPLPLVPPQVPRDIEDDDMWLLLAITYAASSGLVH